MSWIEKFKKQSPWERVSWIGEIALIIVFSTYCVFIIFTPKVTRLPSIVKYSYFYIFGIVHLFRGIRKIISKNKNSSARSDIALGIAWIGAGVLFTLWN